MLHRERAKVNLGVRFINEAFRYQGCLQERNGVILPRMSHVHLALYLCSRGPAVSSI
jgi:hypothetical protein